MTNDILKDAREVVRMVSRLKQLQELYEEIETKQRERVIEQGATDLAHHLQGSANSYGDVAKSLKQLLSGEDSIFHLSEAGEYLYSDCDDPETLAHADKVVFHYKASLGGRYAEEEVFVQPEFSTVAVSVSAMDWSGDPGHSESTLENSGTVNLSPDNADLMAQALILSAQIVRERQGKARLAKPGKEPSNGT